MQVLIIEDEQRVADFLARGLKAEGYFPSVVNDGAEALHAIRTQQPALVILDRMLPSLDGLTICQLIRAQQLQERILMLSALGAVEDRVAGLRLGADDYLVKPFAFSELLARVGALLRRGPAAVAETATTRMTLCDLEMDLLSRKAWRAGQRLDLTAKEFSLLALLARRKGQILSRTTIAEQVWDMNFDSDTNVVEVAVRRLRSKMDDPFKPKLLHNVRGMGYVLEERT